jgi:transcriptional regulator with XRE-family HTH domain
MREFRPIDDVMAELRIWRRTTGLSHKEIAKGAGVDISSVYRLLGDDSHRLRYGSALKAVCKFARVSIAAHRQAAEVPPVVREAVLRTWDGTAEHANRLASAITAVGELIRQAVSSK